MERRLRKGNESQKAFVCCTIKTCNTRQNRYFVCFTKRLGTVLRRRSIRQSRVLYLAKTPAALDDADGAVATADNALHVALLS
jgi:hypothetical protein